MKKQFFGLLGMLMLTPAFADSDLSNMLDKVTLQLKTEKWVTTKTAQVNVSVNAGVADAGIDKLQEQVLGKLAQLSNQGEWHIVSFTRQQDKSGLESVQISAQARLPQSELAALRSKAKSLTRPGETYTIDDVQFTPSDDEMNQANSFMRSAIYAQTKTEIETLNKAYPDQKFYLYRIDFNMQPAAMPMMAMSVARNATVPALNVGNKIETYAVVTLAAMPDFAAKKLPQMTTP